MKTDTQPAVARLTFTCNICGAVVPDWPVAEIDRELVSCACGSTVRLRSIAYLVSLAVFGAPLTLPDFPDRKDICGIGLSDSDNYAQPLSQKLSYVNTFLHQDPILNIEDPPPDRFGSYDFLISADVFEHVLPPPITAFKNAFALLKPGGHLILTVPFTISEKTVEHFPDLREMRIVQFNDDYVMVERDVRGQFRLHTDLVFHGGVGSTLEMRVFCRSDLQRLLQESGFSDVRFMEENYPPFGIMNKCPWGFPILARRPV